MIVLETVFTLFFLVGLFSITAVRSACCRLGKTVANQFLTDLGSRFFYLPLQHLLIKKRTTESLFFALSCAQNVLRFALVALLALEIYQTAVYNLPLGIAFGLMSILGVFLVGEFVPKTMGSQYPTTTLNALGFVSSFFLCLAMPFSIPLLKFLKSTSYTAYFDSMYEAQTQVKQDIIEMIRHADIGTKLDPLDRKIIESVITFRDRLAREVMVPRVDLCALPAETPIDEAAAILDEEGYSRVPIYKTNIDTIVGILMYKDILHTFMEYKSKDNDPAVLKAPVETIAKKVIYTPETKKISHLLQEFRAKQVHMAIVVDEYGGTEGIVTIEDILEEIVGEIADEYDEEEELYTVQQDGSWIVDPKMSILDIETELGIKIPQEADYDTLGGFIFDRAGTIPPKGFIIHHEDYMFEVLKSDERSVTKVRISTHQKEN